MMTLLHWNISSMLYSNTHCPDPRSRKLSGAHCFNLSQWAMAIQRKLTIEETLGDDGTIYVRKPMKFKVDVP